MPPYSSRFVVFEGLDGSGKSTLLQRLALELRQQGQAFCVTREPGGTPLAEEIRGLLLKTSGESPIAETELLLYAASRAQHVSQVIKPALLRGEWVLCDRFSASTVAFQAYGRRLDRSQIDWLNRFAELGAQPDLTVLLDLTVTESQLRRENRKQDSGQANDRMELEADAFHERVRQGYLAQAKDEPSRWLVLDASQAPDVLYEKIKHKLFMERKWLSSRE